MWYYFSIQGNISWLKEYGNYLILVESGEFVSGLEGEGCLVEFENIVIFLNDFFGWGNVL